MKVEQAISFSGASGDFNGDGKLDLAVYYGPPVAENPFNVFLGDGEGSFLIVTNIYVMASKGDPGFLRPVGRAAFR